MADKFIKNIKLRDGECYTVCDPNALPMSGGTMTGELGVEKLTFNTIEEMEQNFAIMVYDNDSATTGKRDCDELLKDIGGISYSMDNASGVLTLKLGK